MNLSIVESNIFNVTNRHLTRHMNKWVLKLIGITNSNLSHEDLLEFITLHVPPSSIQALVFDSFNDFYILFLNNIESFCQLVGRKASTASYTIRFLPLLDFYVVDNVYPSTSNEDLCNTFGNFGHVFQVTNYHILPNSSKFSHILSGKREISFTLPRDQTELFIPINVFHHPYRYHVKKLCSACVTEGHSVLQCPDIEDDVKSEVREDDFSSDSELDYILKTEDAVPFGTENNSCKQLKEVTKNVTSDLEGNASSPLTPHVPLISNKSNASSTITTSGEETSHVPLSNEASEHDLNSSEFPIVPLQLPDKSLQVLEKNISEGCSEIYNPENTNTAIACNSSSNVFGELLAERKLRRYSSVLRHSNENELADERGSYDPSQSGFKWPREAPLQLSPEEEECINNSIGILSPEVLKKALVLDGRKTSRILNTFFMHTTNFKAVSKQLEKLYHEYNKSSAFKSRPGVMLSKLNRLRKLARRFQ